MAKTHDYSVSPLAFLAGALIGAGIALLLAPYSGEETRSKLREYAGRAKDDLIERGREAKATFDKAVERGRETFDSAKERGKQAYEAGMGAVREGGRR